MHLIRHNVKSYIKHYGNDLIESSEKNNCTFRFHLDGEESNTKSFLHNILVPWSQIMQCRQVCHMQKVDHYTPVQSYLDTFRTCKNYNTELDIKKQPQMSLLLSSDTNQTQNPDMHLLCSACTAVRLYMTAKERKEEDKEADLLGCALLWRHTMRWKELSL